MAEFNTSVRDKNIEGLADLTRKLNELASPKEQASTLKLAVRTPMKKVFGRARFNLSKISPGKRKLHRTYKGRLVSTGFAMRSLRTITVMSKDKQSAAAVLGVRKEAFYVLQFFELGTATIRSQPWLMPAFSSSKALMIQGVADVIRKRVMRIARQKAKQK